MWQSLFDEVKELGLVVLAIANDGLQAAKPFIDAANTTYPCLIDHDHYVTDLYNLVNVPQSVWINEQGQIVRAPGSAGSNDSFRAMDRKTGTMSAEIAAQRARTKEQFLEAVRDWANNGSASRFVMPDSTAKTELRLPDESIAQAHALFRLARHLQRNGNEPEAAQYFEQAVKLHPDSWTMWRQQAGKNPNGFAANSDFWERVDALGAKRFHQPFSVGESG